MPKYTVTLRRRLLEICEAEVEVEAADAEAAKAAALELPEDEDCDINWSGVVVAEDDTIEIVGVRR